MRIKHRISFRAEEHTELTFFLSIHGIAWRKGQIVSTVEVFEDSPHWQFIHQYVNERNILMLSGTEFSKAELENAEWLRIRSQWRCGYPQPEEAFGYLSVTYQEGCRCETCGAGKKQIAPFRMRKSPNWGKRHFMMLNWVEDELFVTDVCRRVLEKENLSGMNFSTTCDKKGATILSNINQLRISSKLAPGIIQDRRSIDQVYHCTDCGETKYHPTCIGMIAYDKRIFENAPDFVKTAEFFGWGKGAAHHIIISKRAYHAIVENKLDQGLVFEPVELV